MLEDTDTDTENICVICLEAEDEYNSPPYKCDELLIHDTCQCEYYVHDTCLRQWIINRPYYDELKCLVCSSPVERRLSCYEIVLDKCTLSRAAKVLLCKYIFYLGGTVIFMSFLYGGNL